MTMTVRWMAHDPCSAGSTGRRVERYAEEWVVWLCGWNVRLSIPGIEPLAEGMYSTGALDPVNRYRYLADPCTAVTSRTSALTLTQRFQGHSNPSLLFFRPRIGLLSNCFLRRLQKRGGSKSRGAGDGVDHEVTASTDRIWNRHIPRPVGRRWEIGFIGKHSFIRPYSTWIWTWTTSSWLELHMVEL